MVEVIKVMSHAAVEIPLCQHMHLSVSFIRETQAVLCPVRLALVCTWQEWSAGAMAVLAGTNPASTQQSPNSEAGSKKKRECSPLQNGRATPRIWTWTRADKCATVQVLAPVKHIFPAGLVGLTPSHSCSENCTVCLKSNSFYVHCDFMRVGLMKCFNCK